MRPAASGEGEGGSSFVFWAWVLGPGYLIWEASPPGFFASHPSRRQLTQVLRMKIFFAAKSKTRWAVPAIRQRMTTDSILKRQSEHKNAIPRHDECPSFGQSHPQGRAHATLKRGRRECRVRVAP